MNRSHEDATRVVRAWLEEGSTELSDRVLDGVLREFPTTPQDWPFWSQRGHSLMNTFAKFAVTAAAVVVLTVVGVNLLSPSGGLGRPPPPVSPPPSPTPTGQTSPSPFPSDVNFGPGDYRIGRHSVTVDGVPFSFDISTRHWEPWWRGGVPTGSLRLNKSVIDGQGAEGLVYWTAFPEGLYTELCASLLDPLVGSSIADIATAVSNAAGTELVTEPMDVSVGGLPAKYVELTVREDLGCDPGYFHVFPAQSGGAFWLTPGVGATIHVWILDVDGTRLFIAGETQHIRDGATEQRLAGLMGEIHQIIDSIQFE